ncbi:MAG: hypothetical protein R3233_05970, partial [Xanthomonadales bacterium]|nr:hypothetical protein [Xanthomonadales bacterium]
MLKLKLTALAAAVALWSGAALAATAPSGPSVSAAEAEAAPNTWFVQLRSAPARTSSQKKALAAERAAFRTDARNAG